MSNNNPGIRIKHVPPTVHEELLNICKNRGITLNSMLKPELRKIVDSYPVEMKKPIDVVRKDPEIEINDVSPQLYEELINICAHLRIPLSSMLKPELRKIAESYPEKMKKTFIP